MQAKKKKTSMHILLNGFHFVMFTHITQPDLSLFQYWSIRRLSSPLESPPSLAIKGVLETKLSMSCSKSFSFNWERLPICGVWSSSSRKWDFWLQLCDGISFHGMLWQIVLTAMFKDSIVKIKKLRNMGCMGTIYQCRERWQNTYTLVLKHIQS